MWPNTSSYFISVHSVQWLVSGAMDSYGMYPPAVILSALEHQMPSIGMFDSFEITVDSN